MDKCTPGGDRSQGSGSAGPFTQSRVAPPGTQRDSAERSSSINRPRCLPCICTSNGRGTTLAVAIYETGRSDTRRYPRPRRLPGALSSDVPGGGISGSYGSDRCGEPCGGASAGVDPGPDAGPYLHRSPVERDPPRRTRGFSRLSTPPTGTRSTPHTPGT